jgi:serine/threonine protein kinase
VQPLLQLDAGSMDVKTALQANTCGVKISDFGLSIRMPRDASHVSNVPNVHHSTPAYTAPEVKAHRRLLKASDVFAMGVIMGEVRSDESAYHCRPGMLRTA